MIVCTLFGPANESFGPGLVSEVFKILPADVENSENFDFFKISCKKARQLQKMHFFGHVSARQTSDFDCHVSTGTYGTQ